MERSQFTFYRSFASAIQRIRKDADRAKAYDAICNYALDGKEPDLSGLPDAAAIAFELIKPNLDASKRKAENGKRGANAKQEKGTGKPEANRKQTVSKPQANAKQGETPSEKENEIEKEKENEIENECYKNPPSPFERFWLAYPRKVGKADARKAFAKVKVPIETLLSAIEQQTRSEQWTTENGRFIPNPATWLNQGRWEDELAALESKYHAKPGYGVQRHGDKLTDLERQAIARMMEEDE